MENILKAAVFYSGVYSSKESFVNNEFVQYDFLPVSAAFDPDIDQYDLVITGNPTDHIAMLKIKDKIARFLEGGKALFCFSGWYTNYIPGNKWVMDRDIKTIDTDYIAGSDPHELLKGVQIEELVKQNGIAGWWACGHIEASKSANVILSDILGRGIVVLDEKTTRGTVALTSGGPLNGKVPPGTSGAQATTVLYNNLLLYLFEKMKHPIADVR